MENLTKASYIIFIISIILLFLITRFYEPKERSIADAKVQDEESFVTITGKIEKARSIGKSVILDISETISITAVGNIDPEMNYSGKIGKTVTIIGKISEYEGKKELMIYRMK